MLGGLMEGLVVAWILIQFNVDKICIEVLQPFIKQCELTANHFYFSLGFLGLIGGLIADTIRLGKNNNKEELNGKSYQKKLYRR